MSVCVKQPTDTMLWLVVLNCSLLAANLPPRPYFCLFLQEDSLFCAKFFMPSKRTLWHRQLYAIVVHAEGPFVITDIFAGLPVACAQLTCAQDSNLWGTPIVIT